MTGCPRKNWRKSTRSKAGRFLSSKILILGTGRLPSWDIRFSQAYRLYTLEIWISGQFSKSTIVSASESESRERSITGTSLVNSGSSLIVCRGSIDTGVSRIWSVGTPWLTSGPQTDLRNSSRAFCNSRSRASRLRFWMTLPALGRFCRTRLMTVGDYGMVVRARGWEQTKFNDSG